ncbi:MAG: hypothetical protein N2444_02865, partial [Methylocystis sp.]|nr:hypothetical protein [Methylocystis sp.]
LKAAEMVDQLSKSVGNYFQENYKRYEWPNAQTEWAQGRYGNILCKFMLLSRRSRRPFKHSAPATFFVSAFCNKN